MPEPIESALADIQGAVIRSLALICNHLIEQRALNRGLLVSDLLGLQQEMFEGSVSEFGQMIPGGLAVVLAQNADTSPRSTSEK